MNYDIKYRQMTSYDNVHKDNKCIVSINISKGKI